MNHQLTKDEKKAYVMLFQKDSFSYSLVLMAVLMEFVYVISILDAMPVSYILGITVIGNIIMLFLLFTCAVKVNVYNKVWSYVAILCGVYVLIRQFVLIPVLLQPYDRLIQIMLSNLAGAVLLLIAGFVSLKNSKSKAKLQEKLNLTDI